MMNRTSIFLAFALALVVCITSCKKDSEQPSDAISGDWQEINMGTISRRISFSDNKNFTFTVTADNTINSSTILNGTYQISGDSLKVKINKVTPPENGDTYIPNDKAELYERATYSIKNDTLTLNYISYPADAPVNTVAKFKKLLSFGDDVKH